MYVNSYIGLGSNLVDPIKQVKDAIRAISKFKETNLLKTSSLYKTKPFGNLIQPDYINAVIKIETMLTPMEILKHLLDLEIIHGRIRDKKNRWASRTLDCDILIYDTVRLNTPDLILPHPEMINRITVLQPLYEIEPKMLIDGLSLEQRLKTWNKAEHIKEVMDGWN